MSAAGALVRYRFGRFELEPDGRRLLEGGVLVPMRPHAFDLLVVLVERAGHLVTKDELLKRVWRNIVVEENTLQAHVSALRKVLGMDTISTVSGRGYRFVKEVAQCSIAVEATQPPRHNLPHTITSFIGREKEIAELERLLRRTRLLSLTGAGGCGKTRLALEVARRLVPAYDDGVWLVELAALADPALLPQTVANVFGLREQAASPVIDRITQYLASRQVLLIVDNAEHLLDACADLTEALLVRCARLAILVTSRERIGLTGELAYRVPSLSLPAEDAYATSESVAAYESARLFIDRARLQQPQFAVTDKNAAALASICRRLDGIALALELAVPRLRTLSLEELCDRLDQRFQLLTEGSRTALPRHRTLRSLIDWSHDMLSDAEKALLRRVAVFAGGWSLEAAEYVCGGNTVGSVPVLDLLTSLADKSLVSAELEVGTMRYGLLETVRQYAQDRLQVSEDDARVRHRHLEYFLAIADEGHRHEMAADAPAWLDRIGKERDNFRTALRWSCRPDRDAGEHALRLAGTLSWFWAGRGHFAEGRQWLSAALAAGEGTGDEAAHARGLRALGALSWMQGDVPAAKTAYDRALKIGRKCGDHRQVGITLYNLAVLATLQGDCGEACALCEQSLAIHRTLGDRPMVAMCVCSLGYACERSAARDYFNEALSIWRELGDWRAGLPLDGLGRLAHAEGDLRGAQTFLEESLALARKVDFRISVGTSLSALGAVAYTRGDCHRAAQFLTEALTIQLELGDLSNLPYSLDASAAVTLMSTRPAAAASIWGQAEALREGMGFSMSTACFVGGDTPPVIFAIRALHDRLFAAARAALGDDAAFDRAWSDGRAMHWQQAVRFAVESMKVVLASSPSRNAENSTA